MAQPRTRTTRAPLTRERIIGSAIELADEEGIEALTMRRLGRRLGVKAMSLYNHVRDKDDILDEMAERVVAAFEVPTGKPGWKASLRSSAMSVHAVLLEHPWASGVLESRARAGPVSLRRVDALIGVLTSAGFSIPVVIRTLMALDSHTYGFALQEQAWPFPADEAPQTAAALAESLPAGVYPNVASVVEFVMTSRPGELVDFEFGLDLLLDGLERRLASG